MQEQPEEQTERWRASQHCQHFRASTVHKALVMRFSCISSPSPATTQDGQLLLSLSQRWETGLRQAVTCLRSTARKGLPSLSTVM